jgi:hypothetical protein
MDVPSGTESNSRLDSTNELLAEAMMSMVRGMPRLTVLNAYAAVESLANVVFKATKIQKLVSANVPPEVAEEMVEDERVRHRTEVKFLFHRGLKWATGRSLPGGAWRTQVAIGDLAFCARVLANAATSTATAALRNPRMSQRAVAAGVIPRE